MQRKASSGEGLEFLRRNVSYDGADCLIWPFGRSKGYGAVNVNGRVQVASRVMCQLAHGDPPIEGADAAHSCGRGNQGCVNPKHLRWASRADNIADAVSHGTHNMGEKHHRSKLTKEQVVAIYASAEPVADLARRFQVTIETVYYIQAGKVWKSVTREMAPRPGRERDCGQRGKLNVATKLSNSEVLQIVADRRSSAPIAKDYRVSPATIQNIKNGKVWGWLTGVRRAG